jgi:hypothetical protein
MRLKVVILKRNNPYKLNLGFNFMGLPSAKNRALERYQKTVSYINKELDIIEGVNYQDSQNFFNQLPIRARDFILGVKSDEKYHASMEKFPRDVKDDCLVERVLYLSRVADYLKKKSQESKYAPAQGSFWEEIGGILENLALEVENKI